MNILTRSREWRKAEGLSRGKIGVRHSAWTPSAAPLTNFPVIGGHAVMALPRVYQPASWEQLHPDHFPSYQDGGGVYALYWDGELVYIGRSKCFRTRIKTHNEWMPFDSIKLLCVTDRDEQIRRESNLIARLRPRFNALVPKHYVSRRPRGAHS